MPVCVGVGLVEDARVEAAAAARGNGVLQRVFTPPEVAYCSSRPVPWPHYAARLAARRAALGAGLRPGTPAWASLLSLLSDMGDTRGVDAQAGLSLSLSHDAGVALALLTYWG